MDWTNKCSLNMNVECSKIAHLSYMIEGNRIWLITKSNNWSWDRVFVRSMISPTFVGALQLPFGRSLFIDVWIVKVKRRLISWNILNYRYVSYSEGPINSGLHLWVSWKIEIAKALWSSTCFKLMIQHLFCL